MNNVSSLINEAKKLADEIKQENEEIRKMYGSLLMKKNLSSEEFTLALKMKSIYLNIKVAIDGTERFTPQETDS